MIPIDGLIGQKFGRLRVTSLAPKHESGKRTWICECECGGKKVVCGTDLLKGKVKSCGCLRHDVSSRYVHGGARTKLYEVFKTMRQRCNNPKNQHYDLYGGRGISICNEWGNFEAFREWSLSNGYKEGLTLDRINNDGNYEPNNCRWVTIKKQCNNRRTNVFVTIGGITKTVAEWAEVSGVSRYTLYSRVRRGVAEGDLLKGGTYENY